MKATQSCLETFDKLVEKYRTKLEANFWMKEFERCLTTLYPTPNSF